MDALDKAQPKTHTAALEASMTAALPLVRTIVLSSRPTLAAVASTAVRQDAWASSTAQSLFRTAATWSNISPRAAISPYDAINISQYVN